ncbi:serine--tRNA ligase [Photorhabdus tasmaniensis]|uniref:serine--tRNA ligase n=1 Tax=Photorhabdus tasmaniensis TaxID=1004159 RepID=UPI0010F3D2E3
MLDIKLIREKPEFIQQICNNRGLDFDVSQIIALDHRKRKIQQELELLRAESKKLAQNLAKLPDTERNAGIIRGKQLKYEISILENIFEKIASEYNNLVIRLPNLYSDDTPIGKTEDHNVEFKVYGETPKFNFEPLDHIKIGARIGMDFEAGTRVGGAGFPLLRGNLARLETALMRFVLDQAIEKGFEQVSVPLMAKAEIMQGLGFNPRRNEEGNELFPLENDGLYMIGTAEIPLIGQFSDCILPESILPIRMTALSPCFRREGASGRRDAGLYRNKMFHKVELVSIVEPETSSAMLEQLLEFEIEIFKQLGLYFRVIKICSGDLGAPAYKKYDLEAWMLGRGGSDNWGWGELTSCSNCTDYQARRLKIRYRNCDGNIIFPHTLNATGITTRAIIPILEQNQLENSQIQIPKVLLKYINSEYL